MATYYVDASQPNDDGDGLSEENAWKTIAKLQAELNGDQSDDIVKFKCGEEWREQYTVAGYGASGHQFVHTEYGSGVDPLIVGSTDLSGESWTQKNSDDIWYCNTLSTDPHTVWLDGVTYEEAVDADSVDSADRWYWDGGATRLYVYATSNPTSFYSTIEAPARAYAGRLSDRSYITLDGIHFKYGADATVQARGNSNYNTIQNCTIEGSGRYATLAINDNANYNTVDNCIISGDNKSVSTNTVWVKNDSTNYPDNTTVKNCTISNGSHTTCVFANTSDCLIENNEIYSSSEFGRAAEVLGISGKGGNIFRYNYVHDSNGYIGHPFSDGTNQFNGDGNEIYYNIFSGTTRKGMNFLDWDDGGYGQLVCKNNRIYNNVIYGFDLYGIIISFTVVGDTNNEIKNNIIFGNDSTDHYQIYSDDAADLDDVIVANNCIYDSATSSTIYANGAARTVAYMETNYSSYWFGNIVSNPLVIDTANDDFKLQSNSPCIGKGVAVGLTQDYEGNTVPNGNFPDMGAYEWQGVIISEGIKVEIV